MGSVVVSDVVTHFPTSMFGASGGHHQSQDSPAAAVHQQRSTPLRSGAVDASANNHDGRHTSTVAPTGDVSMSDAGASRSADSAQHTYRSPPERGTGRAADTTPQAPQVQRPDEPPEGPRIPHNTHPPSTSSHGSQPRAGSSSAVSPVPVAHPAPSVGASHPQPPNKIKVQSLSHIQSFATDDSSLFSQTRSSSRRTRRDPSDVGPQYEISDMPVADVIEMVAGLLTKITTTNDRQHEHLHRQIPPTGEGGPTSTANMNQQTSSVLAFHGKNVPSISILSYLSRIHKYCPTTYEVFLSLLVYFDRMTERVNSGPMQSLRRASQQGVPYEHGSLRSRNSSVSSSTTTRQASSRHQEQAHLHVHPSTPTPPPSGSFEKPADSGSMGQPEQPSPIPLHPDRPDAALDAELYNLSHFFVVDSFNIHRLVIAGVTCASKFFSDIFYTNSRYAKVGGLPLVELNHLELQFLLLNDFRLSVPLEEMEAYGTMLVEFYAREVVAQQQAQMQQPGSGAPGGLMSSS